MDEKDRQDGQPQEQQKKGLKIDKLEDRIAPAMVGGIIDAPMDVDAEADAVDDAPPTDMDTEFDMDMEPVDDFIPPNGEIEFAEDVETDAAAEPVELPDADHYPEGTSVNADGSVTFQPPVDCDFNPETGTVDIPYDSADWATPEGVTVSPDGAVTTDIPEDVKFDPEANTMTWFHTDLTDGK